MVRYVMNVHRVNMAVRDCSSCKKISMDNAVPVRLIVSVFMFKERMKMQRGKEKRDPQQDYRCT